MSIAQTHAAVTTNTVVDDAATSSHVPCATKRAHHGSHDAAAVATLDGAPEMLPAASAGHVTRNPAARKIDRGLVALVPPNELRYAIRFRALSLANRFRVIRTIDVAIACFPERPYKAALSAAQRAMRAMTKEKLLLRYRTDRFQHVYGLTVAGARWLDENGVDSTPSVRRVADMSNPEHSLWMHFITLACEARGLMSRTESEALQHLNHDRPEGAAVRQGFVTVLAGSKKRVLRPDVISYEPDGVTWHEIDRSKRGADREAALAALARHVGNKLVTGDVLRRVVVQSKNERILKRALAILRDHVKASDRPHAPTDRTFREIEEGVFEVWAELEQQHSDGRIGIENRRVGHVVVQLIPTWLPKVRLDAKNRHPLTGWLSENYLPYHRPTSLGPWPRPKSPLRSPPSEGTL
ncbi:replication-relaxation family protein [Caballeronia sp. LZ029]|uniref:replication-relaxation family protein n=1 Tax=Caballeronia sp. LZ029 TaxID=3038564 RepID=UPI002866EBEB|nr:replication-relaxation family protein [Caballeronia sp. LZ029]MDR5743958.1 replication-relaxation family protein [Caballeronia sp. LZ029]